MGSLRNKTLDGLKYILIIFVVIGHFIEGSIFKNQISSHLYSIIYSFHMPLFVGISGYFYKHRTFKDEIYKCAPFLEVCLISHLCFTLFLNNGITILGLIDFGASPAWYLLSLIFWRLGSTFLLKRFNPKQLLRLSIVLEILVFVCLPKYGGMFSFMRTIQFYPFFLFGYCMKDKIQELRRYKWVIYCLGLISAIFVLYTSGFLQWQCFYERDGIISLSAFSNYNLIWLLAFRYVTKICSVFISLFVLLISDNKMTKTFAVFGKSTLFIYYGQTILFPLVIKHIHSLRISLVVSILTVIILTFISSKTISKILMNPISTLLSKRVTH